MLGAPGLFGSARAVSLRVSKQPAVPGRNLKGPSGPDVEDNVDNSGPA